MTGWLTTCIFFHLYSLCNCVTYHSRKRCPMLFLQHREGIPKETRCLQYSWIVAGVRPSGTRLPPLPRFRLAYTTYHVFHHSWITRCHVTRSTTRCVVMGFNFSTCIINSMKNSVAWIRDRTIPTERPLIAAKLVPTFVDLGVLRSQRGWSLRPYSLLSRPEP
jgi:hypothetical protein